MSRLDQLGEQPDESRERVAKALVTIVHDTCIKLHTQAEMLHAEWLEMNTSKRHLKMQYMKDLCADIVRDLGHVRLYLP